jgi:hypothetical protein
MRIRAPTEPPTAPPITAADPESEAPWTELLGAVIELPPSVGATLPDATGATSTGAPVVSTGAATGRATGAAAGGFTGGANGEPSGINICGQGRDSSLRSKFRGFEERTVSET